MTSSFGTYHDLDTILASILSTIKINYQGCGEYSLTDAFFVATIPLDPHTQGCSTHQGPRPETTSQIYHLGSTIFITKCILDGAKNAPDINTWLYKEPPPKNEVLIDHIKQKYP